MFARSVIMRTQHTIWVTINLSLMKIIVKRRVIQNILIVNKSHIKGTKKNISVLSRAERGAETVGTRGPTPDDSQF